MHVDGRKRLAAAISFSGLVLILLALAGCSTIRLDSGASTGIEGPSNTESPEEAAEVQAVINDAKPQSFPQQLEGCWKSYVSKFDSFKPLEMQPDALLTVACCVPATYVLCFNRGSGGILLTISNPGFRMDSPWINTGLIPIDSRTDLVFSNGGDFAVLRSFAHYQVRASFLGVPSLTATLSSQMDLRATYIGSDRVNADGASQYVCSGSRMLNCDGESWAETTWHGEFTRVFQQH